MVTSVSLRLRCEYVERDPGRGSGQPATCKEFHMERIRLCGSEIRVKRKLLLLLWHKRPLCPWFLFLFLICNHFLTTFVFLLSRKFPNASNQLVTVQGCTGQAQRPCTCAQTRDRSHGGWCGLARAHGTVQPRVLRHDDHALGACPARSSHFPCQHDQDQSARRLHKW